MTERVPFIGREKELAEIAQNLQDWGSKRVVCIHGPGGVGKTRLLEEIGNHYQRSATLQITDVMDFDDLALHIAENLELRIAQALGQNAFQPYLRELQRLSSMEASGMDALSLANQAQGTHQAFIENYNQVTRERRVVLLFDTTERLHEQHVWDDFQLLIREAQNTLFILAGRNTSEIYQELRHVPDSTASLLNLEPFQQADSSAYLAGKLALLHINVEADLAAKLLFMAQGRPILLDLAVEYISRNIPLSWLIESDLTSLQALPPEQLAERQSEFETALMGDLEKLRSQIDRLVLLLSRVYPLDVAGIGKMLRLAADEAQELYNEARTYPFIKHMPGEKISLHDEMRRIIGVRVWPVIDSAQGRQRRDSQLAVQYFDQLIAELATHINNMITLESTSRAEAVPQTELAAFMQREAAERQRWAATEQLIYHALFANLEDGFNRFCQIFDQATRFHRLTVRAMLLEQIAPWLPQLSPAQKMGVELRKIIQTIELGDYQTGRQMATDLLKQPGLSVDYRLDVLTRLANCHRLLGHHREAADTFEEALRVCRSTPALMVWQGTLLNSLGLVYREMGQFSAALENYNQALAVTFEAPQMASALNNIGYIWALQGKYRSAAKYCEQALAIRQKHQRQREIGMSYSTLGELYRNWGKYDEAIAFYNQALDIFNEEQDLLWLARVHSYRGAIYRLDDRYDEAIAELQKSIDYNIKVEQPWAYHVLGCVYWNRGELATALQCFETSDHLAAEVHDIRTQVNNLVGSAEVCYEQWGQSGYRDEALVRLIRQKAVALDILVGQGYKHHTGRLQKVLADIAFYQGDYDRAFPLYKVAYAGLGSRSGGYGKRKFSDELEQLTEKINQLSHSNPRQVIRWCQDFREAWTNSDILRKDELITLCDVCEVEARLKLQSPT
jgi:tetratricopeptide (TPR) repeat protein